MIRTITIIEEQDGKGNFNYKISGDLPLDAAARALVIIAFSAEPPKKPLPEKEGTKSADAPAEVLHPL